MGVPLLQNRAGRTLRRSAVAIYVFEPQAASVPVPTNIATASWHRASRLAPTDSRPRL